MRLKLLNVANWLHSYDRRDKWRNVFIDEEWPVITEIELERSSAIMKHVLKSSQ
jgi:hypothetical protein